MMPQVVTSGDDKAGAPAAGAPAAGAPAAGGPVTKKRTRAQAGFTMLVFIWAVALMAIMMGVAVQSVSFQMQREREAELIFRGEQYVEAIRLYKKQFGRNPMRLKEIWEAKPRVIRKKWEDPITRSEKWGLVFVGQDKPRRGIPGVPGGQGSGEQEPDDGGKDPGRGGKPGKPGGKEPQTIGPIIGVYSKSCDESIREYKGRTTYCEWKFILKEGQQGTGSGGPGGGGGGGGG